MVSMTCGHKVLFELVVPRSHATADTFPGSTCLFPWGHSVSAEWPQSLSKMSQKFPKSPDTTWEQRERDSTQAQRGLSRRDRRFQHVSLEEPSCQNPNLTQAWGKPLQRQHGPQERQERNQAPRNPVGHFRHPTTPQRLPGHAGPSDPNMPTSRLPECGRVRQGDYFHSAQARFLVMPEILLVPQGRDRVRTLTVCP